jgi:exodeoxyribonuclease VII small subunit
MTKKQSFEEALARLEEIIGQLESGDLKLDQMLKSYEEGSQIINFCISRLKEVEGKIKKLSGKDDSDFKVELLDES